MSEQVTAAAPTSISVTISAGQSISDFVTVGGKICGLIMPSDWDTAAITFQGSQLGVTGFDIYDDGVERSISSAQAVASRMLSLDLNDWLCVNAIRIRSGTAGLPVIQTVDRVIRLILAG